ncbi:MAG: BrnA antitoxin family protein [Hyphomicrobiaceae bacterium]|jgi:Uncharacterized protein conserved in bacteria
MSKLARDAKSGRFLAKTSPKRHRWEQDPDLTDEDNPEWTEEDFARATPVSELPPEIRNAFPRSRGRPKKADPKVVVSIRLDPDIVDAFKAEGPGWQTRINAELRKVVQRKKKVG